MSEADLDVIREQYDATNRGDFDHAMDLYADDVVLIVPPSIEGIQNPGTYRGKDEVGEWFGDWFRTFAHGYHFDLDEIRELEGGVIFMTAGHGGKGRLSGVEVHGQNTYLYWVRDGKIAKVGFFARREEALQAASLPEWSDPKTD